MSRLKQAAALLVMTGVAPSAAAWALGEAMSPLPDWAECALLFAAFVAGIYLFVDDLLPD